MRRVTSKQVAEIADVDYVHLEAKLTEKGIRLLAIHDRYF